MNTTYTSNPNIVTTKAETMSGTTLNLLSYDLANTVGAYLTINLDEDNERWVLTLNAKSNRELSRVNINYDGVMGDALRSLTLDYNEKIIRAITLKGNIIDCDISELIDILETEINDEMLRAISAEEELATAINNEELRAKAAEAVLQENIDSLNSKVDAEVLRLDGRIDSETAARIKAVSDEETARIAADEVLDGKISDEAEARAIAVSEEAELRAAADEALDVAKQNVLTAGTNIQINNDVISATDTTYTAGNGLSLSNTEFSIDETITATKADLNSYSLLVDAGHTIELTIDSNYVLSLSLKNSAGTVLGTTQTVDLPLETMVVNGSYDAENKEIILVLDNGNEIQIPVADLVDGLQSEITVDNKLSADLVDDTNTTNLFVSSEEKSEWSGKQDALVSGTNIKTINNESLVGSGNITISTNRPFPSDWNNYTNGTTKEFCDHVNADPTALQGMSYLGDVYFSDLPFTGNGDALVEITHHNTPTSGKVIHITLTSTTDSPYHWEYGYWSNHTAKGWVGYQPQLVAGNNITLTETTEYDSNNSPKKTKVTIDAADTVYTAGTNVQINNNVISATDTTYSAGDNIDITNTEISVASGNATQGQILTADGSGSATWETLETTTDYNDLENVPIENISISTQYEAGKYYKEEDSTELKSFYNGQVLSVPADRIYVDITKENSLSTLLPTLTYSEFDTGLDLYLSPLITFTSNAGLFAMKYNTADPVYMIVAMTDGFKIIYATAAGSITFEGQSLSWSQGFNNLDSNNSTAWTVDETMSGSFTIANVINVGNWNGNILGSDNELQSGKISRYLDNELKSILDESNFEDYTKIDLGTFILDTTNITGNNPFVGFSADVIISDEDFDKAVNNSQVIAKGQIILTHQQAGIVGTYDICMPKAQVLSLSNLYNIAFATPLLGEIENATQFVFTVNNERSSGEKHGVFEALQANAITEVKTLDTTSTSSLSPNDSENIDGSGSIQLHKISKTGNYDDLANIPITSLNNFDSSFEVDDVLNKYDAIHIDTSKETDLATYISSLGLSSNETRDLVSFGVYNTNYVWLQVKKFDSDNQFMLLLKYATSYSNYNTIVLYCSYNGLSFNSVSYNKGFYNLDSLGNYIISFSYMLIDDDITVYSVEPNFTHIITYRKYSSLENNNWYNNSGDIFQYVDNKAICFSNCADNKLDKTNPSGTGSFSISRKVGTTISNNSIAVGYNTEASAQYATAIGNSASALSTNSIALGKNVRADAENSIAIGESKVYDVYSYYYYHSSNSDTVYISSYGQSILNDIGVGDIVYIEYNGNLTKYTISKIWVEQESSSYYNICMKMNNASFSYSGTRKMYIAGLAHSTSAISLGYASAEGSSSVAIGKGTVTTSPNQIAIGVYNKYNVDSSYTKGSLSFSSQVTTDITSYAYVYRLLDGTTSQIKWEAPVYYSKYTSGYSSTYGTFGYTIPGYINVKSTDELFCSYNNSKKTISEIVNNGGSTSFGSYIYVSNLSFTTSNYTTTGTYLEMVGNGCKDRRSNARTLDWEGNEVLAGKLTATGVAISGGTSSQFIKADGSTDSNTYLVRSDIPDYIYDYSSIKWEVSGSSSIVGRYIWKDGEQLYYSDGTSNLYYSTSSHSWYSKSWYSVSGLNGESIWNDADGNPYFTKYDTDSSSWKTYTINRSMSGGYWKQVSWGDSTSESLQQYFNTIWTWNGNTYMGSSSTNGNYKLNTDQMIWEAYQFRGKYDQPSTHYQDITINGSYIWKDATGNLFCGTSFRWMDDYDWQYLWNSWSINGSTGNYDFIESRATIKYYSPTVWNYNGTTYMYYSTTNKIYAKNAWYAWTEFTWYTPPTAMYSNQFSRDLYTLENESKIYYVSPSTAPTCYSVINRVPEKLSDLVLDSESATSGQVLTADGLGGASWTTPSTPELYQHNIKLFDSNLHKAASFTILSDVSTQYTYSAIATYLYNNSLNTYDCCLNATGCEYVNSVIYNIFGVISLNGTEIKAISYGSNSAGGVASDTIAEATTTLEDVVIRIM